MDENTRDTRDPDDIQNEIEQRRGDLAESLGELSHVVRERMDVKLQAHRAWYRVRARARDRWDMVRAHARENPRPYLAAAGGVLVFGALLAACRMRTSARVLPPGWMAVPPPDR